MLSGKISTFKPACISLGTPFPCGKEMNQIRCHTRISPNIVTFCKLIVLIFTLNSVKFTKRVLFVYQRFSAPQADHQQIYHNQKGYHALQEISFIDFFFLWGHRHDFGPTTDDRHQTGRWNWEKLNLRSSKAANLPVLLALVPEQDVTG